MLSQQTTIIGISTAFCITTIWSVSVRLLQRKVLSGNYKTHDWFILAATVFALIMSLGLMISTSFGLGYHEADIDPQVAIKMRKTLLFTNLFYLSCNMFVKLSLLEFYKDLTLSKTGRHCITFMTFVSVGFGVSSMIVVLVQCVPIAKIFDPTVPGSCSHINFMDFFLANGFMMIFIDVVLYAMPVVFTWNLQMTTSNKLGLYIVFGLGLIVLLASGLRVWVAYEIKATGDLAYRYGSVLLCSTVENHLAIFVACAPYIKSLTKTSLSRVSSLYGSFRSRISPFTNKSSEDRDRITSLGPAHGPPMIPPVRRTGGFRSALRPYECFGGFARRTSKIDTLDEGDVELAEKGVHPALREKSWCVDEGGKDCVIVQLDSVNSGESSRYSTPMATPTGAAAMVLEKAFLGDGV